MATLNRSVVIVKPRQPYLEWTRADDAEGLASSVYGAMRDEPQVYLLPEYEDPLVQQEVLDVFWPAIFEAMLECWVTDEALWPNGRTRAMFDKWFEIQMCSLVQDLYFSEPLELL